MIELKKENITEYLKTKMPDLDYSRPLVIEEVGDGPEEEDGDGYLNFIFRVSDGDKKLIVKQGRSAGRKGGFVNLSEERNQLEFQSMQIRKAIVPDLLPDLYFFDAENHIFVMEDVSHLKIVRFQLNQSVMFPKFAKQAARYLAATHFYTSEYYLGTKEFRELTIHFMNHKMRDIYDNLAFVTKTDESQPYGLLLDEQYAPYIKDIVFDPAVVKERYKLRQAFITHGEALLHGDFHTSNIFIDQEEMKVIDMEYTFCGPMAFDVGYLESNFLSQYACAAFRPYDSEKERKEFQAYLLSMMKELFDEYCERFFTYWNRDSKDIYRNVEGMQKAVQDDLLSDVIGFCACLNMARCSTAISFPEYDVLDDPMQKQHAICLAMLLNQKLLLNRSNYKNSMEWIQDIIRTENTYKSVVRKIK
jgi:5-methylthioribose kinase